MFLGRVKGNVVASHKLEALEGATFRIVEPITAEDEVIGSPLVAIDTVSSRVGDKVYLVKGKEATMPWVRSPLAPIDAAIVGLVDGVQRS